MGIPRYFRYARTAVMLRPVISATARSSIIPSNAFSLSLHEVPWGGCGGRTTPLRASCLINIRRSRFLFGLHLRLAARNNPFRVASFAGLPLRAADCAAACSGVFARSRPRAAFLAAIAMAQDRGITAWCLPSFGRHRGRFSTSKPWFRTLPNGARLPPRSLASQREPIPRRQ